MIDFSRRPRIPNEQLASITNMLAGWLPTGEGGETTADWSLPEWEAACWVVYWHNALPQLAHRIRESGTAVPDGVSHLLAGLEADSRERTRRMLDAAVEFMAASADEGIESIPLKGATLAPIYYDDPLMRPLADLDILVRPADLDRAAKILKRLGYRYYSRSAEDVVYLRGERQANVWSPDNVHPIELHFTLREEYAGFGYNLADLIWASAKRGQYWKGIRALLPRRHALLHHVCAHATSDWLIQRGRIVQIDDVRRITSKMEDADWRAFSNVITDYNARFIFPALVAAKRYAAATIPSEVSAALRDRCPTALLAWSDRADLAGSSESNPAGRSGLGFDLARMLARSPRELRQFWLRSIFPRRWNLSKRYPRLIASPLWPLGYLLINLDRAWRLVAKRFV